MMTTLAITGTGLIFTGTMIGIGFAFSRVISDKISKAWISLKARVSRAILRVFQAAARIKYGMDAAQFQQFTVDTIAGNA